MNVTKGVGRTRFTSHGRETGGDWNFFTFARKKGLGCVILRNIGGDFKVTVSAGTLGMDLRPWVLASKPNIFGSEWISLYARGCAREPGVRGHRYDGNLGWEAY